jgi:hypothetical protein
MSHSAPLRRDPRFWILLLSFLVTTGIGNWRVFIEDGATDFDGFWHRGELVLDRDNHDGLVPDFRRYLPFFSVLMAPFALLPMPVAGVIWNLLAILSLFGVFRLSWNLAGGSSQSVTRSAVYYTTAFAVAFYIGAHNLMSQVTIMAVFLSLAGLEAITRQRAMTGGFLVALAAAVKIFPGIFLVYFLLKRQWAAACAFMGGFIMMFVFTLFIFGVDEGIELHRVWLRESASTTGTAFYEQGRSLRYNNHSLLAVMGRTMIEGINAGKRRKLFQVNIVTLQPGTVVCIMRLIQFLLLAVFAAICLRSRRLRLSEIGYGLALSSFFIPVAWSFHFVVLISGTMALSAASDRTSRGWLYAAAAVQLTLFFPVVCAVGGLLLASLLVMSGTARLAWQDRQATTK